LLNFVEGIDLEGNDNLLRNVFWIKI